MPASRAGWPAGLVERVEQPVQLAVVDVHHRVDLGTAAVVAPQLSGVPARGPSALATVATSSIERPASSGTTWVVTVPTATVIGS